MNAGPSVMGIINVTSDSFFPASRVASIEEALTTGMAMFAAGVDIVDVGGESTRPGADDVSESEELARVVPVVQALSAFGPVSIDTQKEAVARAAVAAGATVINDVSATLAEVAGELGVGYVGMHRQGDARTMQVNPTYTDVVAEVSAFLDHLALRARSAGVTKLWLDPGIGFGKTTQHNVSLLAATSELREMADRHGAGLLIGTSRKRFLSDLSGSGLPVEERYEASLAANAFAMMEGATMVRVHDVTAAVALRELLERPAEEVIA